MKASNKEQFLACIKAGHHFVISLQWLSHITSAGGEYTVLSSKVNGIAFISRTWTHDLKWLPI